MCVHICVHMCFACMTRVCVHMCIDTHACPCLHTFASVHVYVCACVYMGASMCVPHAQVLDTSGPGRHEGEKGEMQEAATASALRARAVRSAHLEPDFSMIDGLTSNTLF